MSGISSRQLFIQRGVPLLLVAGVLGAALLSGCGGGGGNGNNNGGTTGTGTTGTGTTGTGTGTGGGQFNASVIGKVTDTQGNGVPGVSLVPGSGGSAATSLSQGGYRLDNLAGNIVEKITAAITQNGTQYTGSTQVLTQGNFLVSNANILLSPADRQATISGTVQDTSTPPNPLAGVRVFLALPNTSSATNSGNYSSLVAYTDANGSYSITNVPVDSPSGTALLISASTPGRQNQTFTLPTLQAGGGYNQAFTLSASTGQSLAVPTIFAVTTATEPTDSQSGRLRAPRAATASIYEKLRRLLTPSYARTADRRAATGRRKIAQALGDYAIETDLAFDNSPLSGSVIGYSVYRTNGSTPPTKSAQPYDFLQDPLANYYADLTFSTNQSTTLANVQYNFAISATNTDNAETALSQTFSIIPLSPLTLNQPQPGQSFVNPVTVTWNAVTGAQRYFVFVYDQYPSISVSPIYSSPIAIPAGTNTAALPSLTRGLDYYVVVVGAADQNEDLLPGQSTPSTPIANAETTFSQITRFHVQ